MYMQAELWLVTVLLTSVDHTAVAAGGWVEEEASWSFTGRVTPRMSDLSKAHVVLLFVSWETVRTGPGTQ